jgi:hypothetical protein
LRQLLLAILDDAISGLRAGPSPEQLHLGRNASNLIAFWPLVHRAAPSPAFLAMANVPAPRASTPSAPPPVRPHRVAGGLDSPGDRVAAALRELARELPLAVTVRGECMAPRLRDGDRVAVAPARRYWPGDIVAFHTPQGRLALHRLLGYRLAAGRLACVTRGDRCSLPDPPLAPERLLGRAAVRPTARERARAAMALFALALRAAGRRLMPFTG